MSAVSFQFLGLKKASFQGMGGKSGCRKSLLYDYFGEQIKHRNEAILITIFQNILTNISKY